MAFVGYFEKLKIETFDKIMTLIPFNSKVRFTDYYMNDRYESKELLSHPRDFVIDFASWLKKNIFNIKNVSDSISQTIAYAAYKEVNKGLKILFMDKITSFNMIDIGNIRQEVIYLETLADEELSFISSKNFELIFLQNFDNFFRTEGNFIDDSTTFGLFLACRTR